MAAIQELPIEPTVVGPGERPVLRLLPGGLSQTSVTPTIYRRRRLAAAAFAVLLVVGSSAGVLAGFRLLVGGPGSGSLTAPAATSSAVAPSGTAVHVVQPGDTVWSVARHVTAPGDDVRATVDAVVAANGGSTVLHPGQRLALPG